MPPPVIQSKATPANRAEDRIAEIASSFEKQQQRLREISEAVSRSQKKEERAAEESRAVSEQLPAASVVQQPRQAASEPKDQDVADKIARVPDEHLPSHRERQRWDFSKRLSELMDDVLPKLAVVTQKVNSYTGTDYSGVEALRREIMEQGRSYLLCTLNTSNNDQRSLSRLAGLLLIQQSNRSTSLRMRRSPLRKR